MDAQTYLYFQNSRFSEINPKTCPCRGGWLSTNYDTWHACKLHGKGVPHPEDENDNFDYDAHNIKIRREAYATFRDIAMRNGFKGSFKAACLALMGEDRSPQAWVDAADDVAMQIVRDAEEASARKRGFSCALEARWSDDAAQERADHRSNWC